MKFYIDEEKTREIGNSIISTTEKLDYHISALKGEVDDLKQHWQGDDATKYIDVMQQINIPAVEKLNNIIKNYGNYLKTIPTIYELLDDEYSTKTIE